MKIIASAFFYMGEQMANYEREYSCCEACPIQDKQNVIGWIHG